MKTYVSYLRVSTKKQGLGIDAQRRDVNDLVGSDNIVKEFVEQETGTNKRNRPVLEEAIEYCKKNGYDLVVAKIDRLTRNVEFLYRIHREMQDAKLEIKFADFPEADMFVVGIMGLVAQKEADMISKRTKDALRNVPKEKKGNPVLRDKSDPRYRKIQANKVEAIREKSNNNSNNRKAKAYIGELRSKGMSYRSIADELNRSGFVTARGKEFSSIQVSRLVK